MNGTTIQVVIVVDDSNHAVISGVKNPNWGRGIPYDDYAVRQHKFPGVFGGQLGNDTKPTKKSNSLLVREVLFHNIDVLHDLCLLSKYSADPIFITNKNSISQKRNYVKKKYNFMIFIWIKKQNLDKNIK